MRKEADDLEPYEYEDEDFHNLLDEYILVDEYESRIREERMKKKIMSDDVPKFNPEAFYIRRHTESLKLWKVRMEEETGYKPTAYESHNRFFSYPPPSDEQKKEHFRIIEEREKKEKETREKKEKETREKKEKETREKYYADSKEREVKWYDPMFILSQVIFFGFILLLMFLAMKCGSGDSFRGFGK
jgi:hypothetical protein